MTEASEDRTEPPAPARTSPVLLAAGSLLFATSGLFALGRLRRGALWLSVLVAAVLAVPWLPRFAMVALPVAWLGSVVDTLRQAHRRPAG